MDNDTIAFTCRYCWESFTVPAPQDLSMVADVMAAHGATHGKDWRDMAAQATLLVEVQRALSETEG